MSVHSGNTRLQEYHLRAVVPLIVSFSLVWALSLLFSGLGPEALAGAGGAIVTLQVFRAHHRSWRRSLWAAFVVGLIAGGIAWVSLRTFASWYPAWADKNVMLAYALGLTLIFGLFAQKDASRNDFLR